MTKENNNAKLMLMIKSVIFSLVLAFSAALIYRLAFALTTPSWTEIDGNSNQPLVVSAIVACLYCFAVSRTHLEFSKSLRNYYYSLDCYPKRLKFVVLSSGFITDTVFFAVAFALTDIDIIPGYFASLKSYETVLQDYAILLIALGAFIIIDFLALYSGVATWIRSEDEAEIQNRGMDDETVLAKQSSKLVPTVPKFAAMRFLARTYTVNANTSPDMTYDYKLSDSDFSKKKLVGSYFVIALGCALFILFGEYVYQIAELVRLAITKVILTWQFAVVVAAVILAVFCIRIFNAFFKRYKFAKKLREVCNENPNIKITAVHPFKTLFARKQSGNECDLVLSVDENEYSCSFITCKSKSDPVILDGDGKLFMIHALTFAGIKLFQHTAKSEYAFYSDNSKILIVNPVSKFIYILKDGKLTELDNGDDVGEYKIFTGNSFINALNRNCLDRVAAPNRFDD